MGVQMPSRHDGGRSGPRGMDVRVMLSSLAISIIRVMSDDPEGMKARELALPPANDSIVYLARAVLESSSWL